MIKYLKAYEDWWYQAISGKAVSIFRIGFGIFLMADASFFIFFLNSYFPLQKIYFKFPAFAWWPHFNPEINFLILLSLGFSGLLISIGFKTRVAAAWAALSLLHLLLMEASVYLNHLVLSFFICVALIFVPSDRRYTFKNSASLRGDDSIFRYQHFTLIILFWMSYTYSAIEKAKPEWFNGDIIAANMGLARKTNMIANLLYRPEFLKIEAWGSFLLELLAPLGLVYRRTRNFTIAALILFHLINHLTMNIGLFSFLMFASMVLYLPLKSLSYK